MSEGNQPVEQQNPQVQQEQVQQEQPASYATWLAGQPESVR